MRLDTISIKGVLRYAEAVRLDLRELPAGLIAVCGPNGEGKTSLLEAPLAALYRELPTRRTRPLVDYTLAEDSHLEVTFALDGRGDFRARVNLDGPHRKTDAILALIQPDGRERILTDGKVTSYDAAIAELLPPFDLLLASVFAAQNRAGSFITIDRAKRKQLFATLLGLDHYERLSERARSAAGLVQQPLERLRARREVLARDAGEEVAAALETTAQRLQTETRDVETAKQRLQADLQAIQGELEALQAAAAAHAAAQARADVLDVELRGATLERTRVLASIDEVQVTLDAERSDGRETMTRAVAAIDRLIGDTSTHEREVQRIETALQASEAELATRIHKNRELLHQAEEIRLAAASLAETEQAIAASRLTEAAIRQQLEDARQHEQTLLAELRTIEQTATELTRVEADATLLAKVPCGGQGTFAPCQFLTKAAAAQARIPDLKAAVRPKVVTDQALATVRTSINDLRSGLAEVQRRLTETERQTAVLKPIAANEPHVRLAEERIATHQARLRELVDDAARQRFAAGEAEARRVADLRTRKAEREQQYQTDLTALIRRSDTRRDELRARGDRLERTIPAHTEQLTRLRGELATTADAADHAAAQRALLQLRQRAWDETTATGARLESERAAVERQRTILAERQVELQEADQQLSALAQDLDEWQLLARAFARDGLPMIEIDNAGPTVTAYTNDLLQTCYGSRFTVELVTQEAKVSKGKDGSTMKDAFELRVFDAARGGEPRDLTDLSGGEQVLVDEALKSAIALLVNAKNQQPFRTCWRDETTGALDPENSARYIDMLRRVQQLGGFHHLFFVSHNPEAWGQADAQLHVAGGRIEVRLPPYGRQAVAA